MEKRFKTVLYLLGIPDHVMREVDSYNESYLNKPYKWSTFLECSANMVSLVWRGIQSEDVANTTTKSSAIQ